MSQTCTLNYIFYKFTFINKLCSQSGVYNCPKADVKQHLLNYRTVDQVSKRYVQLSNSWLGDMAVFTTADQLIGDLEYNCSTNSWSSVRLANTTVEQLHDQWSSVRVGCTTVEQLISDQVSEWGVQLSNSWSRLLKVEKQQDTAVHHWGADQTAWNSIIN